MIRAVLLLSLGLFGSPASAEGARGLYVVDGMDMGLAIGPNGLVYFNLVGPELGAVRAQQAEVEGDTRVDLFEPGADAPVRASMSLADIADGGLTVATAAQGFFLPQGATRVPITGLPDRCLDPIRSPGAFVGDFVGMRTGRTEFTLSQTEFITRSGGGQDAFGNPTEERVLTLPIETAMAAPDRLRIGHPDGAMMADHLGLGMAMVALFGPRGSFMTELYPLSGRTDCLSLARRQAEGDNR